MYKGQPWTIADTRRHSELSRPSRSRFGGTGPGSSDRPWGGLCARQPLPCAVVLRLQTGLTANLHGFRICALEGWPLLQRHARALALTCGVKGHQAGRCGGPFRDCSSMLRRIAASLCELAQVFTPQLTELINKPLYSDVWVGRPSARGTAARQRAAP